ncbi:hypothetical protein QQF64_021698 [Cirrhinus molitorella]|uniref:Secreted protein n=1 Tax=Cirrhinus molitorella TaxID=172907 RepID=A0ABR3L7K4_9TELE
MQRDIVRIRASQVGRFMSLILTASSFLPSIVLHPVDYCCSLCHNSTNRDQLSLQPVCHHNICLLARPLQVYGAPTGACKERPVTEAQKISFWTGTQQSAFIQV